MKNIGYFKAIGLSFYSRELYRDVAENWGAGVVWYLLLVLAICIIPITSTIQRAINLHLPSFTADYVSQVPLIHIKDGIVNTPENKPYYIKNVKTNEIFAIVDTSGKFKTLENVSADFLLTKTEMISRNSDNVIKIETISPKVKLDIDPVKINQQLTDWAGWLWVVIFPGTLLAIFVYRFIQALFYAGIGMIFSLIMKIDLRYGVIFKLAIVSLTPAIMLRTVVDLAGYHFYREGLFFFVLSMVYLIFAMKASKKEAA